MSAILERWHARLENWALFLTSGTAHASAGVSSIYKGGRITFETLRPAPLIGDASDVDPLVHRLEDAHRRALVAEFVWTGAAIDRAAALGCHVDTLRNRVQAACFRLDDLEQTRRQSSISSFRAPT
jgi:hypothetical protein